MNTGQEAELEVLRASVSRMETSPSEGQLRVREVEMV